MSEENVPETTSKRKLNLSFDYRIVTIVLLVVLAVMLAVWKPWSGNNGKTSDRTISVTGEAQVKAQPDEYVFNPSYDFKSDDKAVALKELTKKSAEVISKLKSLGVEDNKIKTNSSGSDYPVYYPEEKNKQATYTLSLTVTVTKRDLSQQVQDYLITTNPTGAVSPQASFSDSKRKELESQARDKATKEARVKADQSAKNLGFKVGSVKSVEDGSGFGNYYLPYGRDGISSGMPMEDKAKSQLSVQPGENELSYSVSVVYFLR